MRQKRIAHIRADFKRRRANGRPQPSHQLLARRIHFGYAGFNHPVGQPAPACVYGRNHRAGFIAQQHRQAVRREHRAHHAALAGEAGIRLNTCDSRCRIHA